MHVTGDAPTVRRRALRTLAVLTLLWGGCCASRAHADSLPDGRAYELVTRINEPGGEGVLDGASPFLRAISENGEVVDWESLGVCCGADSGNLDQYQARRGAAGWQSESIGPVPEPPLSGFEELQEIVDESGDLSKAVVSTTASYAPGDRRPKGAGGSDLYLREPLGALEWISQGPSGTGRGAYRTDFAGATPNLSEIAFTTAEPLTANATGLSSQKSARYLYVRDPETGTTSLVDVNNEGKLLGSYGASLGDAGPPSEGLFSFGFSGSSTHAISSDGSKVFFQTPPAGVAGLPEEPHLYMRDLATSTTPLDEPTAAGSASYEGASSDGSLVFFTSDEGLGGAPKQKELYEFNTTPTQLGQAPPMTAKAIGGDAGILGVTAISNDGSHVYFVAEGTLAGNTNSAGRLAVSGSPNLYVYDTATGQTTFVTTLARPDVVECRPSCATGEASGLVGSKDVYRPAYTTPDGSVLVFTSSENLTGEAHTPEAIDLFGANAGEHSIAVSDTEGFRTNETIAIGSGANEEEWPIESIQSEEITINGYQFTHEHQAGEPVVAENAEVYRYDDATGKLTCLSCTPAGTLSTQSASLGEAAGGSYAPPGRAAQMSEDGSRIFFDSPDALVPGAGEPNIDDPLEQHNLYEWEEGQLYLIADASEKGASFLGTTASGDDVFFSSRNALVPGAIVGLEHIYDARVDGGFPTEPPSSAPCLEEACREALAPTPFLAQPASAAEGPDEAGAVRSAPTFAVGAITPAERARLARSGHLELTVKASRPGQVHASASTRMHGRSIRVASASSTLRAPGQLELTLTLDASARAQLTNKGSLALRITVTYSASPTVDVVQITAARARQDTRTRHG